jgi:hypothetical protein
MSCEVDALVLVVRETFKIFTVVFEICDIIIIVSTILYLILAV